MADTVFNDLINIFMAKAKDEAYREAMENIKVSYKRLMEIDTQCKRDKVSAIIKAMTEINLELNKFKREYNKLINVFNDEAKETIDRFIKQYEFKYKELLLEKNKLSRL